MEEGSRKRMGPTVNVCLELDTESYELRKERERKVSK